MESRNEIGGTPYDIEGVEFAHEGERCSFDTILRIYESCDRCLDHLAPIVSGADTSRHDLTPQCEGLLAISLGLSANFTDDHDMLRARIGDLRRAPHLVPIAEQGVEVIMPLKVIDTIAIPASVGSSFDHGATMALAAPNYLYVFSPSHGGALALADA